MSKDDLVTELKDASIYEVSLVPNGENGEDSFVVQKMDESNEQDGDDSVTEEKDTVKVEDLSEDDKKELFNKLKDEFDVDEQVKIFLDNDEIADKVKEKLDIDKEEEEEEDETEKSMTPKSREALKTVLGTLSKVKEEMPENYRWVYKAIAKLVDETAPEFEKSANKEFEITDEVRDAVNKSIEQFEKADELSDTEQVIKEALEGLNVEKEEEKEEVSKEAKEQIEKYEQKVEKLRKERNELKQEKIKKELTDKANELENIPESTEKLTELFAELYNLDEDVFKKVENLVKKIDKQSEVGELFKEKGTSQRDIEKNKNESAQDKIDRLVKEKVEKEDKDQAKAMTEVLEDNPDLYKELRGA